MWCVESCVTGPRARCCLEGIVLGEAKVAGGPGIDSDQISAEVWHKNVLATWVCDRFMRVGCFLSSWVWARTGEIEGKVFVRTEAASAIEVECAKGGAGVVGESDAASASRRAIEGTRDWTSDGGRVLDMGKTAIIVDGEGA